MTRPIRRLGTSQWLSKLQKILNTKGISGLSVPCTAYFTRNRRHLFGGVAVILLLTLIAPFTIIKTSKKMKEFMPHSELPEYEQWHNSLQISADSTKRHSTSSSSAFGSCQISKPSNSKKSIDPVLVPVFPGGSSDLMRLLIEATTGILTGKSEMSKDVVAVKTHYPYYENHVSVANVFAEDAKIVIVLRDPLDTLEIWHTFIENTINERNPTTPTTKNKWIEWRDNHFDLEMTQWEKYMRYWLNKERVPINSRFVVIHETLIEPRSGPQETSDMVDFIRKMTNIPKFVHDSEIPCIWHEVLNFQVEAPKPEGRRLQANEESVDYSKPYSYVQLDKVASVLTNMIDEYSYDQKILSALLGYRAKIMERMAAIKGNDPILVHNSHGTCMVTTPHYEEGLTPIIQASYPGSGSQMMRDLIEAITGIRTAESRRRNDVVSVKTLYPYRTLDVAPGFFNRDMTRMIILVRYPLNAIASNFAHIYWLENNIPPHSMQPPKEAWEKWRDENFLNEINAWVDHFMYWINAFKPVNRIIVSYESMYHAEKGPKQALRLALFIKGSHGNAVSVDPAPAFTIPCLWFRAVRLNDQANVDAYQANMFHGNMNYVAQYTTEQLEMAATKINNTYRKFNYDLQLGPLLQSYWEHTISMITYETPDQP